MEKSKLALGLAVLALLVGGLAWLHPTIVTNTVKEITKEVGSVVGPTVPIRTYFLDGLTQGGTRVATTTGVTLTSYTASANELHNAIWAITPAVELALKIGATSTLDLIPNVGDRYTLWITNASSTVASGITFSAADATVGIQLPETTGADLIINGLNSAKVTLIKNANSGTKQVTVLVEEEIPG